MISSMKFEHSPLGQLCLSLAANRADELPNAGNLVNHLKEMDRNEEVVGHAILGCLEFYCSPETNSVVKIDNERGLLLLEMMELLLRACPEAAKYRDSRGANVLHHACRSSQLSSTLCIDVMRLILAQHKNAVLEADVDRYLPVQLAATNCGPEVVEFLLDLYPETVRAVTSTGANLLHLVVCSDPRTRVVPKVRCLCSRYPAMTRQMNIHGMLPIHVLTTTKNVKVIPALYEAGGIEQFQTPIAHPTNTANISNGYLPLHSFIMYQLTYFGPLPSATSEAVDMLRCLLRLFPEAASIEGGLRAYKKTSYRMAVDRSLPSHIRRLLLRAAPALNPTELRRLNYEQRRMAMFLALKAITAKHHAPFLMARLREDNKDLIRLVVSFL